MPAGNVGADPQILALDLSLTATGVCLPDGTTEVWKPRHKGCERLAWFEEKAFAVMQIAWPDVVVLEGYSFGSKGRAVFQTGELGGVMRLYCWFRGIPYVEVPPSCLKKYATGHGNASKDDVLQAGVVRSGHTFKDNNACDAWWLWQMGLAHYCPDHPLLVKMHKTHLEGLSKVEWVSLTPSE